MTLTGRFFLGYLILFFFLTSCKPPVPVYFDRPVGVRVQGFDSTLTGNYIPLEDVLEKGQREFSERYVVRYDRIYKRGSEPAPANANIPYQEMKNMAGEITIKDTCHPPYPQVNCDCLLETFVRFNELAPAEVSKKIERAGQPKPAAAMVQIVYDRVFIITIDSAGQTRKDTLLTLGPDLWLTRFAGKHFLNFRTPEGWEIVQLEVWEGNFLSIRPFYFTSYNECSRNPAELTASMKDIYPNMKPWSQNGKIVGYKATMNPQALIQKFKSSESSIQMLRLKN